MRLITGKSDVKKRLMKGLGGSERAVNEWKTIRAVEFIALHSIRYSLPHDGDDDHYAIFGQNTMACQSGHA